MPNDDAFSTSMDWLVPELSVSTQLRQEVDRRAAANLSRDELAILTDKLIVAWYMHNELINNLLGRIRHLEVDVALSTAQPSTPEPSQEHYEWAKELLGDA